MTPKTAAEAIFAPFASKSWDVLSFWADANRAGHTVLNVLIDFSANASKEALRLTSELQTSAFEAVKNGQESVVGGQSDAQTFTKDPVAWYCKNLQEGIKGTQSTLARLEGNARTVTQSVERLQASAEQAGKDVQQTLTTLGGQLTSLYTPAA